MTTRTIAPAPESSGRSRKDRTALWTWLLTDRAVLLVVLLAALLIWMHVLSDGGYLLSSYSGSYLAGNLAYMAPMLMLAIGETFVIVSGRGGIDLSVGAIVSLVGISFGYMYAFWHWPLLLATLAALLLGAALGAVNGLLIAGLGIPALIATLATSYAYSSTALSIHDSAPISTPRIQGMISMTKPINVPLLDNVLPGIPLQILTFVLPVTLVSWLLLHRSSYGRRLYAIGTNEIAANFAAISVPRTRFTAYVLSGAISGLVAVVTVAQFASARTDAGTTGSGMALPAITVAVLGGVAISGGVGRVIGVAIAALLVAWLNAGILLLVNNSQASELQLFALGALLLVSALLNVITQRYARRVR